MTKGDFYANIIFRALGVVLFVLIIINSFKKDKKDINFLGNKIPTKQNIILNIMPERNILLL